MASSPEGNEEARLSCPKCGSVMRQVYVEAMLIHRCRACGGLWMSATDRDRLLLSHRAVEAVDRGEPAKGEAMDVLTQIRCPVDQTEMIHQVDPQQPHVGFEGCSICGGIFLDAGELHDLEDFTLIERLRAMLG